MRQPLRVVYAAGPGNVLGTYNHWKAGRDDPSQVSITYSGQFYDLCKALGAEAYVVASSSVPGSLRDGPITVRHNPTPFQSSSGLLFHVGQVWTSCRLIWTTLRFRADVLVIVCGTAHWFPFRVLRWLGVQVIPSMHCVLWRKGRPPSGVSRMIGKLNRGFFTNGVASIMSASRDIDAQLRELTGGRVREIHDFLPTYRREEFAGVGDPSRARTPFRCFYAGRIERNKGVFDLLDIATRFRDAGRSEIEFDLCGDGSALKELKAATAERGLSGRFRCHGHCDKSTMRDMFKRCHVVIVPTTSDFVEGFNQVVAEGVLSSRPVITSSVCPALDYVRNAVVEVPPDDAQAYGDAILKLCDDVAFYDATVAASRAAQGQFYDEAQSWGTTLRNILRERGLVA